MRGHALPLSPPHEKHIASSEPTESVKFSVSRITLRAPHGRFSPETSETPSICASELFRFNSAAISAVSVRVTHLDGQGLLGLPRAVDRRGDGFDPVSLIGRFCSDRTNLCASRSNALRSPRPIFDNLTNTVGCGA